ncbi:hypothetical protein OIU77_022605 [Salix suchowensis]|uniref:Secreted protein n=1 Tax=Salix suchowensis TaxID=1278906 RepID=A0ABQ9C0X4_9ROSI|nr:hypothetical protein OIU77_022605 [Salix suchowensis]
MRSQSLFWLGALLFFASNASVLRTVDGDNLASECSSVYQKLMGLLELCSRESEHAHERLLRCSEDHKR